MAEEARQRQLAREAAERAQAEADARSPDAARRQWCEDVARFARKYAEAATEQRRPFNSHDRYWQVTVPRCAIDDAVGTSIVLVDSRGVAWNKHSSLGSPPTRGFTPENCLDVDGRGATSNVRAAFVEALSRPFEPLPARRSWWSRK